MPEPLVIVPWTPEQVESLNAYQASGAMHPFTCGNDSTHRILLATPSGWVCSDCDWRQNWAHSWMADWEWNDGWKPVD